MFLCELPFPEACDRWTPSLPQVVTPAQAQTSGADDDQLVVCLLRLDRAWLAGCGSPRCSSHLCGLPCIRSGPTGGGRGGTRECRGFLLGHPTDQMSPMGGGRQRVMSLSRASARTMVMGLPRRFAALSGWIFPRWIFTTVLDWSSYHRCFPPSNGPSTITPRASY